MTREIGQIRSVMSAVGGLAAVLGLYWDDAWHTDVGRDAFLAPPHLLLYGGVAVLMVAVLSWGWTGCREDGWAALRDPVLALPLAGAAITLVSAPVDDVWHQLFGRDAVVWSPPHMVAVAGMAAFAAGLLLAVHRDQERVPRVAAAVIGAFLIAAAGTVVIEFEADVPQFPVVTYLPVNVAVLTFAFALIRRGCGRAWAVTWAAATYVALRLAVVGFLAVLGHSLPTVMPTVVSAVVLDVGVQRGWRRSGVATMTALATVAPHALAHALQPAGLTLTPSELVIGALLGTAAAWGALAVVGVGDGRPVSQAARLSGVALLSAVLLGVASPALAHDPGQGEEVAQVTLTSVRVGDRIRLELAGADDACHGWRPHRVVARRAGRTVEAPLTADGGCVFRGSVEVDDPGRWFVYAELGLQDGRTEAWLPVEGGRRVKETVLYIAPQPGTPLGQVLAGVALYALVVAILGGVVAAYRRAAPASAAGIRPSSGASTVPRKVNR